MVLRERASLIVELGLAIVAATATLAFVATQRSVPARGNHRSVCVDLPAVPAFEQRTIHVDVPPDMPPIQLGITTADVGTDEAELLRQLTDATRTGMAAEASIEQRFEALVLARRLDLVLAAGHADELAAALAGVRRDRVRVEARLRARADRAHHRREPRPGRRRDHPRGAPAAEQQAGVRLLSC